MLQLRIPSDKLGKSANQADMILARLQVADRQEKRDADRKAVPDGAGGGLARDRTELRSGGVRHYNHLALVQVAVYFQNRFARKLASGQNLRRPLDGLLYRALQLPRPRA